MAFCHAQIGEYERDGFRGHRTSTIGMNCKICWISSLLADRRLQKRLGEFGTFMVGDHPTDDVAAGDIDRRIEIEIRPFLRAVELGDIPNRHAVRSGCGEFGFDVCRSYGLIPRSPTLPMPRSTRYIVEIEA